MPASAKESRSVERTLVQLIEDDLERSKSSCLESVKHRYLTEGRMSERQLEELLMKRFGRRSAVRSISVQTGALAEPEDDNLHFVTVEVTFTLSFRS